MSSQTTIWMAVPALIAISAAGFLRWAGRRRENGALLKTGLSADAEVMASEVSPLGSRIRYTKVILRFLPQGYSEPIEITKYVEGVEDIAVGRIIPVRYLAGHPEISLMVPYADKQDAS